jgi:hypothetical protein
MTAPLLDRGHGERWGQEGVVVVPSPSGLLLGIEQVRPGYAASTKSRSRFSAHPLAWWARDRKSLRCGPFAVPRAENSREQARTASGKPQHSRGFSRVFPAVLGVRTYRGDRI